PGYFGSVNVPVRPLHSVPRSTLTCPLWPCDRSTVPIMSVTSVTAGPSASSITGDKGVSPPRERDPRRTRIATLATQYAQHVIRSITCSAPNSKNDPDRRIRVVLLVAGTGFEPVTSGL